MFFNTVGISLTNKCSANCEMCCYECEPKNTKKIEEPLVMKIIEQAEKLPYIKEMVFSGGEPFLYYEELYTYIRIASKKDLFTSCYTNGSWCKSFEIAEERLSRLKQAGLKILRTSYDFYHAKYISNDQMINLLKASKKVGLKCTLNVGVDKNSINEIPKLFEKLSLSFLEIDTVFYPFMFVGNAEKYLNYSDIIRNVRLRDIRCKHEGIIAIMNDGKVYPCCSPCNISAFCLGNIIDQPLKEIIEGYNKNLLFSKVLIRGLQGIINDITINHLFALPGYYVDACDFCRDVFNDKIKMECLLEFYQNKK